MRVNVPALADRASPSYTLKANVTATIRALATGTYVNPLGFPMAMSSAALTAVAVVHERPSCRQRL